MTRLIFVRHAESESNLNRLFYGARTNVNITDRGRKQAEKTAEYLRDTHIDVAYSSDLVRVIQTAKPTVKGRDIPFIITSGLREIDGGKFDGISWAEIEERYPKELCAWKNDFANSETPDGESVEHLQERIISFVEKITDDNRGKTVLIATHACPIRVMMNKYLGKERFEINTTSWASNASVSIVDIDDNGNPNIILNGYDEHLKDI